MADDRPATWKVVLAAILDFVLVFAVGGWGIARLTGGTTEGGFQLNGWPALALLVLIVLYFYGMGKWGGGTLFRRLFGVV